MILLFIIANVYIINIRKSNEMFYHEIKISEITKLFELNNFIEITIKDSISKKQQSLRVSSNNDS